MEMLIHALNLFPGGIKVEVDSASNLVGLHPRVSPPHLYHPLFAMSTILSGAAFGAALVASGMYQPSVILGQFDFSNFQMLQTFLTASASSTCV
jgi:hypothetical protein